MFLYNKTVEFKDWIVKKYVEWRGDAIGNDRSITDYAKFIGVSQPVMSGWMTGIKPNREQSISKLADKYPDVYSILGLPSPGKQSVTWAELESFRSEASKEIIKSGMAIDSPEARVILNRLIDKYNMPFTIGD